MRDPATASSPNCPVDAETVEDFTAATRVEAEIEKPRDTIPSTISATEKTT
jgi:hypothetical protein